MTNDPRGGLRAGVAAAYAAAAMARRRWFARHPEARRRLGRPVVSIGNLRVGGSAKTPVAAHVARLLRETGERPGILSRGYGRRVHEDGVVVVSDGQRVSADLDRAGDEPLMLARSLPGVAVLVSPDRYLAGRLGETRLARTVHVLDDGFQHFALERDVDLLLVSPDDLAAPQTVPAGRLREPLDAARAADAVLALAEDEREAGEVGARLGVETVFRVRRLFGPVTLVEAGGRAVEPSPGTRVLAVAGIADPQRFVDRLREAGWNVAGELLFADHYRYGTRDLAAIAQAASRVHAVLAVTTGKDLVRLLPQRPFPLPMAVAAYDVCVEPEDAFNEWLIGRLGEAGARRGRAEGAGRAR